MTTLLASPPTDAAICSHHDPSRKAVSTTAHGVAYLRGLESIYHPDDPLFHDPFALTLGGEVGKAWVEKEDSTATREDKLARMASIIIRTKKIDD
eukprot:scaffold9305_cov179-Ochromonas_danica.AAC.1